MQNLAGVRGCDKTIAEELMTAGAEIVKQDARGEVPYSIIGKVGKWKLTRAWYYWVARPEDDERSSGLPLPYANEMHFKPYPPLLDAGKGSHYGDYIRVDGHAGCPPPDEWAMLDHNELMPQIEKLGITDTTYGNLAKLLNDGTLKGDRYVDCYHIDSQEGLNEFVRTIKRFESENPTEHIICATIHFEDDVRHVHQPKGILTGFVVAGHRHNNCYATARILDPFMTYKKFDNVKGFLTNLNRFVNREEAMQIALKAGQVKAGETQNETKLYSEDLY